MGWSSKRVLGIVLSASLVLSITVSSEEETINAYLEAQLVASVVMGALVVLSIPKGLYEGNRCYYRGCMRETGGIPGWKPPEHWKVS